MHNRQFKNQKDRAMKTTVQNNSTEIRIPAQDVELEGELSVPVKSIGLVIFSHGSGSSRFSQRNRMVADELYKLGISTLLFDLLSSKEDAVYANRFDIDKLANRLITATEWTLKQESVKGLNIGYFGASTGAASALQAAAVLKYRIKAVVSRGGRPDLAQAFLGRVKADVLLIVGGLDSEVIELNKSALRQLNSKKELKIISGATHLFEEPGKLEDVTRLSGEWFEKCLQQ
jgi:dienelactone hydrolase